jgi:hypothetical protein
MWNKAKGILIPSDKKVNIILDRGKFELIENAQIAHSINSIVKGFFLYIITDERIKIGEKCFHSNLDEICVADEFMVENPDCKKIIASNDKSLDTNSEDYNFKYLHLFPQPTKESIQQFIDVVNVLNINLNHLISIDLFVEYENNLNDVHRLEDFEFLKLNPDNTINIKFI